MRTGPLANRRYQLTYLITGINRIHLVLLGKQNMILGPYLAAINTILNSVMPLGGCIPRPSFPGRVHRTCDMRKEACHTSKVLRRGRGSHKAIFDQETTNISWHPPGMLTIWSSPYTSCSFLTTSCVPSGLLSSTTTISYFVSLR
jgi:hypothetical protein